ncbi:MAG: class I SAM-dependent methyltransferase [Caulobacteraceae bacterium]|nr:class I SAM-dependent methyltransferase [Caulobacter sp.]
MPAARSAFAADALSVRAQAAAKAVWWNAGGAMVRALARPERDDDAAGRGVTASPPPRDYLRRAYLSAFRKDAEDVAAGLYPPSEQGPSNPAQGVERLLDVLADAREVDARRRREDGVEVRAEAAGEGLPPYYRQNFHYQSGGWLTPESARRYEAQVEALFAGAAGPMRRRALSLLARAWRGEDQRGRRIVDVACGSGAFLVDLRAAFPRAEVSGLDLSAPYAEEARRRSGAEVIEGFAERLPFADASLDAVTCVYLFHELPPKVRRAVAAEFARVLKPGGVLAFADSVQAVDEPELARMLQAFPAYFHEPFYASFQAEDLDALFADAGLTPEGSDAAFLTKARLLRKPAA